MSSDLKKIVVKDLLEVLDENRVGVMPIEGGYKMRVNVAEDGRDPRVKEEGFKQTFGVVLTYY